MENPVKEPVKEVSVGGEVRQEHANKKSALWKVVSLDNGRRYQQGLMRKIKTLIGS
jgi:hypothetical protein